MHLQVLRQPVLTHAAHICLGNLRWSFMHNNTPVLSDWPARKQIVTASGTVAEMKRFMSRMHADAAR